MTPFLPRTMRRRVIRRQQKSGLVGVDVANGRDITTCSVFVSLVAKSSPDLHYPFAITTASSGSGAEGDMLMLHGRFSGHGAPANWIVLDIVRL